MVRGLLEYITVKQINSLGHYKSSPIYNQLMGELKQFSEGSK